MVTIDTYRHPDEFPADVLQLFAVLERQSMEFGVPWYRNLVNTVFAKHEGVRFYGLRKRGHPVAIVPVLVDKLAMGQQATSLSNFYTSLYSPVFEKGLKVRDLVPLVRAIKDAHAPLGSIKFAPMDPQATGFSIWRESLQAVGMVPFKFFCFGNWYWPVDSDWPTYLKGRAGTLRSTIKRSSKKFSAAGGKLELVLGGADLERALAAYEQVYASSWKKPEPFPDFVPGLIRSCAEQGWLRLGVAWLNDKPIAAQLWIVANGRANIYKLAYDENYKAYASGTLLMTMLMEHVIEKDKVLEIDYLIGDDPYKKTWMNQRRERWGLVAYNPKTINGLWGLGREVLGRAGKPIIAKVSDWLANIRKPATSPDSRH
jgi:hypothetical protein